MCLKSAQFTCDVDGPGPHQVHLVPNEDEGAVREAGAGGEADGLQSVRGRQEAAGVSDTALSSSEVIIIHRILTRSQSSFEGGKLYSVYIFVT